jgi:hypothetical protein
METREARILSARAGQVRPMIKDRFPALDSISISSCLPVSFMVSFQCTLKRGQSILTPVAGHRRAYVLTKMNNGINIPSNG